MSTSHQWKFFRAGGVEQAQLESGEDLLHLHELDQRLWIALSCPVKGLELDDVTLSLIDVDDDGYIRAPEVLKAVKWITDVTTQHSELVQPSQGVALASLNREHEEGKRLAFVMEQMLSHLGKPSGARLTVEDVTSVRKDWAAQSRNGDGIVPPGAISDPELQAVAQAVMTCVGSTPDMNGSPGIAQGLLDTFFDALTAYSAWRKQAEDDPTTLLPLGHATAEALDIVNTVQAKVEDYFARCQLMAFDPRVAAAIDGSEARVLGVAEHTLTRNAPEIAALPLAQVKANQPLPLIEGLNPAWEDAMVRLRDRVVLPLRHREGQLPPRSDLEPLSEDEWRQLLARLEPYRTWQAQKAGGVVESLGIDRVRELLAGDARTRMNRLILEDKAREEEFREHGEVERLVRYHRDLHTLLKNFVSFSDFYRLRGAIFQAGTLHIDARTCELCLEVLDAAGHATLAGLAGAYLVYCDLTRAGGQTRTIVAIVSDGDSDNLMVGRNGIFYDRRGMDWNARIKRIIPNPISIREAFWSPYRRLGRMVEEQVAKRASIANEAGTAKLSDAAGQVATADKAPAPTHKFDVGTIAAMGVALGSIATFVGVIIGKFLELGPWMPVGVATVLLMISTPSMVLAYVRLRTRNLAPILDANGWAINTRARINVPLGNRLTQLAKLPPGTQPPAGDPFADKERPWNVYVTIFVMLLGSYLWLLGSLDPYLPGPIRKSEVLPSFTVEHPKLPAVGASKPASSDPAPAAPAPAAPGAPAPAPAPAAPANK